MGPFFITTILHIPNKLSNSKKADRIEEVKDNLTSVLFNTSKYNDFSYIGRSVLKQKYLNIPGIYLWVNIINNKCYVGKSINLYLRFSKYLASSYINNNKNKMAIVELYLNMRLNFLLFMH